MRILKTFGVVLGAGLVVALASAFVAGAIYARESMAGLIVFAAAVIMGNPIGNIIGLVLANRVLRLPGSVTLGVIGAVVGGAAIFALLRFSGKIHLTVLTIIPILAAPTVLSTLGYCLRQPHK